MFAPLIERPRARPPAEEEDVDLHLDVKLGDGAGGNRAVRFVDGVDLAVLPVVDGLGVTCGWGRMGWSDCWHSVQWVIDGAVWGRSIVRISFG